jgi:DNA polymerase-1
MISKLYGTYIDGLIDKADASGRIHTTFYQTGTATGRISSADPNLQNIPVRTEQGRIIRRAFVPRDAQRLLVSADYSQIELRLLAHMSGDETFIHAFLNGEDIHARTAARCLTSRPIITRKLRRQGGQPRMSTYQRFGLARNLGASRKEAAGYIERFFERYPLVRAYMDRNVAMAKSEGYVQTLFGRRRYIPELKSGNHNTRAFGERVTMNAPIQGTAADIIKLAMVQVSRGLEAAALDARMILQVHDELILDAAQDQAQAAGELLKTHMQGAAQLCVPLLVSVKYANNWQDAK